MNRILKILAATVLITAAILIEGCQDSATETNGTEGQVQVLLTDAPFPIDFVESVDIIIDEVYIRHKDGTDADFLLLTDEDHYTDLTTLRNGNTESIALAGLPEGMYDHIRIVIQSASITLTDGRTFDLDIPSGETSGLKIFIDPGIEIESETTSTLLLDFDLSKSFVVEGNPDTPAGIKGFKLKPVIRAMPLGFAGSIKGTVTDADGNPIEDAYIIAVSDNIEISTYTDANGNYEILGLLEGSYDITVSASGYIDTISEDVMVIESETTEEDFTMQEE